MHTLNYRQNQELTGSGVRYAKHSVSAMWSRKMATSELSSQMAVPSGFAEIRAISLGRSQSQPLLLMAGLRTTRKYRESRLKMSYTPVLQQGDFVQVKRDSGTKAGRDGMAMGQDDGSTVGLIFFSDRHNEVQDCECCGVELWELNELDLETVCR